MNYSIKKILVILLILGILVQTFSCASDDDEPEREKTGKSSSSEAVAKQFAYCVFFEQGLCLSGPFSVCQENGVPSNTCHFDNAQSSGSAGRSSSSVELKNCDIAYNTENEFCYDGEIFNKCAGMAYNPKNEFCYDEIYAKCDGMVYDPSTHVCVGKSAVRASCNGEGYNPLTQRCNNNVVQSMCGNQWYNSSIICYDNINYSLSDIFTDNRDQKKYKIVGIGTQIWMAENLNHDVGTSACYDESEPNCNTYGRLYNWQTALDACPFGWHLPTDAEWDVLAKYADLNWISNSSGGNVLGKKLKAANGWNFNSGSSGTDEYGFSALPGGYAIGTSFNYAGDDGYWWSASESDNSLAYLRYMSYEHGEAIRYNYHKTYLFSVRCLRD